MPGLAESGLDARVIMQVHRTQLVLGSCARMQVAQLQRGLAHGNGRSRPKLDVPLVVDVGVGTTGMRPLEAIIRGC